ncbi:MAG: hypothetical protein ABW128_08265 [Rhizorhabdus sp.]
MTSAQPVARCDRIANDLLALREILDLKHAEAKLWHPNAIV